MFLLEWMGGLVFWGGVYGAAGMVVGTVLLRNMARETYRWIKTGERGFCDSAFEYCIVALVIYLLWPILAVGAVFVMAVRYLVGPMLRKAIKTVDSAVPHIEIKKREEG
jgi:hypothetical protein